MLFEDEEERLLEGSSINVVGLSGSGRSGWLNAFSDHLVNDGWHCLRWSLADLRRMSRSDMKEILRSHCEGELPVVLIDDFGSFLMEDDGQWLEGLLLSAVNNRDEAKDSLRVVLVTTPRDREIIGMASVLRERCHVTVPVPIDPDADVLEQLGCASRSDLEALTGLSTRLVASGSVSANEARGVLMSRSDDLLPLLVGQLDGAQQRRLGTVLRRAAPARFRVDQGDRTLRPLVVAHPAEGASSSSPVCLVPSVVRIDELAALLLPERWPDRDQRLSARRFAARCGNEPAPIWTDNYLSDTDQLDFELLVQFLTEVLRHRPPGTKLRLLSRNFVGGSPVHPSHLRSALERAGLPPEVAGRIEWRVYDMRTTGNLHQRELALPRRGVGFSLPIVTMLVGQAAVGNETDAELPLFEVSPTQMAWSVATPVPLASAS